MKSGTHELRFGPDHFTAAGLDRTVFPETGITRGDLVAYYCDLANLILPYLRGRALAAHRFPQGIGKPGVMDTEAHGDLPSWVDTAVMGHGDSHRYLVCNKKSTLAYLIVHGCVTPHYWLSTIDSSHKPDRLVFMLEPAAGDEAFDQARRGALRLRRLLYRLELRAYVKAAGSSRLHVITPILPTMDVEQIHHLAHRIADLAMHHEFNDVAGRETRRDGEALHIDISHNVYAGTAIVPYGVLPQPDAPVAMPLHWEELNDTAGACDFNFKNVGTALIKRPDPWITINENPGDPVRARALINE